jgi:hypothetical protein
MRKDSLRKAGLRGKARTARLGLRLGLSMLAAIMTAGGGGPLHAQQGRGGAIVLAPEILAPPGVETPMPLLVQPPASVSGGVMMLIRGLPSDITISEGRAFGQGVWAIPLTSAGRLSIAPAASASGVSEVSVELVTLDGAKLAHATTIIRVAAQQDIAGQQPTASVQPRAVGRPDAGQGAGGSAPRQARLTRDEEEHLDKMIAKGNELMRDGKVAAARLLFQRAADSGSGAGALALGSSFDPNELKRWNTVGGVNADTKLARQWYSLARELGSNEAGRRLQQLEAR